VYEDRSGSEIFVYDLAADHLYVAAGFPNERLYYPVWSPDSQWIAFQRRQSGEVIGLYLVRADGTDLQPLLVNEEYRGAYNFVWIP
jgi:hypothetical protein